MHMNNRAVTRRIRTYVSSRLIVLSTALMASTISYNTNMKSSFCESVRSLKDWSFRACLCVSASLFSRDVSIIMPLFPKLSRIAAC